jgi:hypothetical protein
VQKIPQDFRGMEKGNRFVVDWMMEKPASPFHLKGARSEL